MPRPNDDLRFWQILAAEGQSIVHTLRSMEEWEVSYLMAKLEIEHECGRYTKDLGYGVDEAGNGYFRDRW